MTAITPNPGFDPSRVNWLAPDQPLIAEGAEAEACSYCGDAIDEMTVRLRMWNELGWGAVFCDHCSTVWWGLQSYDDIEPQHEPEVQQRRKR